MSNIYSVHNYKQKSGKKYWRDVLPVYNRKEYYCLANTYESNPSAMRHCNEKHMDFSPLAVLSPTLTLSHRSLQANTVDSVSTTYLQ